MKKLAGCLITVLVLLVLVPGAPVKAQGTEVLKPTAHTWLGKGTDNGANAYDTTTAGDTTTSDTIGVGAENILSTQTYHTWQTPGQTHTARNLYVMRSGTGNVDDTWDIQYSTDGGTGWTAIETGNLNPAQGSTSAVSISTGLDLSLLQVRIDTSKSGGPDGGTCDIFDVWLESTYAAVADISNTPNSYNFGLLAQSSTADTTLTYFTISNNSSSAVSITIGATDMTGGVTWTLSDAATPGADTYGLKSGLSGGSFNVTVKKNGPFNVLIYSLAASSTQQWGLQILAPTTFSDGGVKSGTVTLTATLL